MGISVRFPRGVEVVTSAVIRDAAGKILLTQSPKWSGKWVLPGGHIEPGESIVAAAQRETEEETGLTLSPVCVLTSGELIGSRDFHRPAHFVYFDCVFNLVGGTLRLQDDELTAARWVTPQEALDYDLGESYPEVMRKYLEFLTTERRPPARR
ncbi:MAG: NUDIX domain-containing protein [Patescibacteria group bacterium]|nr:NUDIX domain-containing protein [Patescibacteria group bacterium]